MIYDCFNFYNEFELLDIRLNELDSIVDKFVLAESTVTFTNKKKPLYFSENKKRYKKFLHKIIHVVIDDSPNVTNPWIIENHQLSSVVRGLPKCDPNDTILVSCVDEIPKLETILKWRGKPGRHKVLMQTMSYYYLNYVSKNRGLWPGTLMFSYKDLKYFPSVYIARFMPIDVKVPDGGWHMSYIGGVKKIQLKLASFSHQEYNNDNYNTPERIERAILEGKDPFGFGWKFRAEDINTLPKYVIENQEKFKDSILAKSNDISPSMVKITELELKHLIRVKLLRKYIKRWLS